MYFVFSSFKWQNARLKNMNRRTSLEVLLTSSLGVALLPQQLWSNNALAAVNEDAVPFYEAFSQHLLGDHYSAVAPLGVSIGCFIQNCLTEKAIKDLNTGLSQLQAHCLTRHKNRFEQLSNQQQHEVLIASFDPSAAPFPKAALFAQQLRGIALFHFFNTEYGATKVLRYLPVPGRYDGAVPLTSTARTWTH